MTPSQRPKDAINEPAEREADRREANERRFMEFCNDCWNLPSEDHPIFKLSTADLRRIYKLAEHWAAIPRAALAPEAGR